MCPNTVYSFNLSLPTPSAALYERITATAILSCILRIKGGAGTLLLSAFSPQ